MVRERYHGLTPAEITLNVVGSDPQNIKNIKTHPEEDSIKGLQYAVETLVANDYFQAEESLQREIAEKVYRKITAA